jgi:hypothetical protein
MKAPKIRGTTIKDEMSFNEIKAYSQAHPKVFFTFPSTAGLCGIITFTHRDVEITAWGNLREESLFYYSEWRTIFYDTTVTGKAVEINFRRDDVGTEFSIHSAAIFDKPQSALLVH